MKIKLQILILMIAFIAPVANASGWSGWLTIQRIDLHPDWGVRVVFNEVVDATCGATMAEWNAVSNDIFMVTTQPDLG